MDALILVDVQNVFYGAKNYRPDRKIDYIRLKDFITQKIEEQLREEMVLKTHVPCKFEAYVVKTPSYEGMSFFVFLKKAGYNLHVKVCGPKEENESDPGSVGSMMQMDLINEAPRYNLVAVVSGSGIYEPAFRAIRRNWPHIKTMLFAFANTLHRGYTKDSTFIDKEPSALDSIILLGDDVLHEGITQENRRD